MSETYRIISEDWPNPPQCDDHSLSGPSTHFTRKREVIEISIAKRIRAYGRDPGVSKGTRWDCQITEKKETPNQARVGSVESVFKSEARKWKDETYHFSSMDRMVLHPSYQRIIGLGPAVVPLILQELASDSDQWFWALRSITGENPVPKEHRGKLDLMTKDWLEWGARRGYLSASTKTSRI